MPSVDITIPYPVLTGLEVFNVTIYDSGGSPVHTSTEDNTLFTVVLPSGSYTMDTEFDGVTNQWCFTVASCDCPVLTDYAMTVHTGGIISEDMSYYRLVLEFDISGGFSCPFDIIVTDFTEFPTERVVSINTFSDFTSSIGTTAYKLIYMPTHSTSFRIITRASSIGGYRVCYPDTYVAYGCGAPHYPFVAPSNAITESLGIYILTLSFPDCGVTCHTVTVNYLQIGVPHPDSGSITLTIPCGGAFPHIHTITLSPDLTFSALNYQLQFVDCCGDLWVPGVNATNY